MRQLMGQSDLALAIGIVAILLVLLLPIPPWLIDLLLAVSITFSILILLVSLLAIWLADPKILSGFGGLFGQLGTDQSSMSMMFTA